MLQYQHDRPARAWALCGQVDVTVQLCGLTFELEIELHLSRDPAHVLLVPASVS